MNIRLDRDEFQKRAVGHLLNRYLTLYAAALVLLGVAAAGLSRGTYAALALLAVTSVGNGAITRMMRQRPSQIILTRNLLVAFNYLFYIPLVYLLWPRWRAVWILLMLSMINVAIFEDRKTTAGTAGLFSIVLLYTAWVRGAHTVPLACEVLIYIVSLWTAGLLINRLYNPKN